jgi:tetratricopeptide (TPR) repeat protein
VKKGQLDKAISDYTQALEINPNLAKAYFNRGVFYYFKREYEKSWKDVKNAQSLGYQIHPKFLDQLRKESGRQN